MKQSNIITVAKFVETYANFSSTTLQKNSNKYSIYIDKNAPQVTIVDAWFVKERLGTTQWYISMAKSNANGWGEGVVGVYHVHKFKDIRLFLVVYPAKERRRYFLTTSHIGWAQT